MGMAGSKTISVLEPAYSNSRIQIDAKSSNADLITGNVRHYQKKALEE